MADETRTRLNRPSAEPPAVKKPQKASTETEIKANPKWPPFIDKEHLPKDAQFDKKGRVTKAGTVQYATLTSPNGTVKLLGYFRNGKGLARRMIKLLKPQKKNSRGMSDRALLKELRGAGVKDLTTY